MGSVALLITRLPLLRSQHSLESYLSREAIFLFNNLLLVGLAFAVFWGTMFPILSEAARGERITVGQGYYDQVAMPIGIALLVLTGVGPLIAWRKASAAQLRRRFVVPVRDRRRSRAIPLLAFTDLGARARPRCATVVAGVFVTACIAGRVLARHCGCATPSAGSRWPGALVGMVARNRRRYGGYIVHLGDRRAVHRPGGLQGLRHRGRHRPAPRASARRWPATPSSTRARRARRRPQDRPSSVRLGVYRGRRAASPP